MTADLRLEYFRNNALIKLQNKLKSTILSYKNVIDIENNRSKPDQELNYYIEKLRDLIREMKSNLNSTRKSLGADLLTILSCEGKSGTEWVNLYNGFYKKIETVCDSGDNYIESITYGNPKANEFKIDFFNKFSSLRHSCLEIMDKLEHALISGMTDFCVLPKKHQLESSIMPKSGTLLCFDLEKSKQIKAEVRNSVCNEARRIGFNNEAWEWADEGDGLILIFADHEESPLVSHQERGLLSALEITARICYKYIIGPDECANSNTIKSGKDFRLQNIRIALNTWEGDNDQLSSSLADLKYVIDDVSIKYTNTIFIIGSNLLDSLSGKYRVHRVSFCQALKPHLPSGKDLFWSSPIGWRTLKLILEGSETNDIDYKFRNCRYQVPGCQEVKINLNKNGKSVQGKIHDISVGGVKILMHPLAYNPDCHFEIGDQIIIKNINCPNSIIDNRLGIIIGNETYSDKKIMYLHIKYDQAISYSSLMSFLKDCNSGCSVRI